MMRWSQLGRRIATAGNKPVPLAGSHKLWLVAGGQIEVFAHGSHGAPGAGIDGRHVATLRSGEIAFGFAEDAELRLAARGRLGSELIEIDAAALEPRLHHEEDSAWLAQQVDGWLERLYLPLLGNAPVKFQELPVRSEVALAAGAAGRPAGQLVWVRHLAGRSLFLGRPELAIDRDGFLVPLPKTTWLAAESAASLSLIDTLALVRNRSIWEALARGHELYRRHLQLAALALEEREEASRELRLRRDRNVVRGAMHQLAGVLGRQDAPPPVDELADPLVAACALIGQAQGISFRRPPNARKDQAVTLVRLCIVSRVRHRKVQLRGRWWQEDQGPLLAFLNVPGEPERRPVALLPAGRGAYELADPRQNTRRPVDAELAAQLAPEAQMFYRPLPERPLQFLDLIRQALEGKGDDLRRIVLMGLSGGLLALLNPLLVAQFVGQAIPSSNRSLLLQMTLGLVLAAISAAGFQVVRSLAVLRLSGRLDGSLQAAIWDRLLGLPANFFRRFSVGDLADRSMGIDAIRDFLTGDILTSFLSAFFSVFSLALLFYYDARLALLAVALVLLLALVTFGSALLQIYFQRHVYDQRGKLASLLLGWLGGLAKIRVASAERRVFSLWAEKFSELRRTTVKAQQVAVLQTTFGGAYGLLASLSIFAMVGAAATSAGTTGEEALPLADFLAFHAAFGQFQAATMGLVAALAGFLPIVPLYERLLPILKETPEVDPEKLDPGELAGRVELSRISFRYQADGPLILNDVSISAAPGEMIALVGPSGAGKSTCLRLLLGFEQPTSGSVYYDGQDLPSLDIQSVRRQIGVVLQGGRPLIGNLFSYIVGNTDHTLEEAYEAARIAGVDQEIRALPMEMFTTITEGATTFSGGQRQRLMIARAVIDRPRLLLLDEATSALDNRTQEIVSRGLGTLKTTRIVVAHRLSTVVDADRIYVLDAGRVAEVGTYAELMERRGIFFDLARRQTL